MIIYTFINLLCERDGFNDGFIESEKLLQIILIEKYTFPAIISWTITLGSGFPVDMLDVYRIYNCTARHTFNFQIPHVFFAKITPHQIWPTSAQSTPFHHLFIQKVIQHVIKKWSFDQKYLLFHYLSLQRSIIFVFVSLLFFWWFIYFVFFYSIFFFFYFDNCNIPTFVCSPIWQVEIPMVYFQNNKSVFWCNRSN